MSRNDIYFHSADGLNTVPTNRWVVIAGTGGAILAGEPSTLTARGSNTVVLVVDGGPDFSGAGVSVIPYAGVAAADSTEVSSLRGYVDTYKPTIGVYAALAKTSTTADTLIEVDNLLGKQQIFDVTNRKFTIDATGTNSASNTLVLQGGDKDKAEIWFEFLVNATYLGNYTPSMT